MTYQQISGKQIVLTSENWNTYISGSVFHVHWMQGGLRWQWRYVSSLCEISMMWQWMQWTRRSASDLRLWMVGIWWLLCVQLAVAFFQDRSLEVLQRIFLCCVKVSSALSQNFQQWRELQQGNLDSCKLTSAPFFQMISPEVLHGEGVWYATSTQRSCALWRAVPGALASSGPFRLCFDLFFHHACLLAGDTYHWSDRVELNWESGKTLILSQGRDERGHLSFLVHCVEWRSLPSSASKNTKATKRILQWVQWTCHDVDTWQNRFGWSVFCELWSKDVVSSIDCGTVLCWGLT